MGGAPVFIWGQMKELHWKALHFFFNSEFSEGLVFSCRLDFETSPVGSWSETFEITAVLCCIWGGGGDNVNMFLVNHG